MVDTSLTFARTPLELESALADAPDLVILDLTTNGWDYEAFFRRAGCRGASSPVLGFTTHALARATQPLHARCAPRRDQGDADPGAAGAAQERSGGMTGEEFVRDLDARNQTILKRLDPESTLQARGQGRADGSQPAQGRPQERDRSHGNRLAMLVATDDVEVKMAFARQAGDEAKHYRMIADRLRDLGFDARAFNPVAKGYGPLFQFLDRLTTTVRAGGRGTVHARGHRRGEEPPVHRILRAGRGQGDGDALSRRDRSRMSTSTTSSGARSSSASP